MATSTERVRKHRAANGAAVPQLAELLENADNLPDPPRRELLLKALGVVALEGNVPAIRLLLEEYRRDGDSNEESGSAVDELARRRAG
jgi:hypothetical protein